MTPGGMKNSSTPIHQAFYPPSVEPCLLPQKGSSEEPQLENMPMPLPFPPAYSETLEPTVFVGSAINPNEDSTHCVRGTGRVGNTLSSALYWLVLAKEPGQKGNDHLTS